MNKFIPEITKPTRMSPSSLGLAGQPKCGKSTIIADFTVNFAPGESVILCVDDQSPYEQLTAAAIQFNKASEFENYLDQIIASGEKIKYGFIDHLTKLDEYSELAGTIEYMQTPQGSHFNKGLTPRDKSWRSVHELANGAGYRFSRNVMLRWKNKCHQAFKHVVFIVHLKDKDIVNAEGQTLRIEKKLSLTGKLATIIPAYVSGTCYMYADGNKRYLDFAASEKAVVGATLPHLDGQILISEKDEEGNIKTYWNKIFVD